MNCPQETNWGLSKQEPVILSVIRSCRRTEHARSTWLCELVSSVRPSLSLLTWNTKRGWITLFEENASHFLSIHHDNCRVHVQHLAACLAFDLLQVVKSVVVGIKTGGHVPLCTMFPGNLTRSSLSQAVSAELITLGCFCKEPQAFQPHCQHKTFSTDSRGDLEASLLQFFLNLLFMMNQNFCSIKHVK